MAEKVTIELSAKDLASVVLKKAAAKQKKSFSDMSKSIFFSLGAFDQITRKAQGFLNFAKRGAGAIEMEQQFDSLAKRMGGNSKDILESLDKAASGTVSKLGLMKSATAALSFEFAPDKLPKLLEIARLKGKQFALDTEEAFSAMVRGIARKSPKILDDIGILTTGLKENANAAELINSVIKNGQEELDALGGNIETAADQFRRFDANVKNVTDNLSKFVLIGIKGFQVLFFDFSRFLNNLLSKVALFVSKNLDIVTESVGGITNIISGGIEAILTLLSKIPSDLLERLGLKGISETATMALESMRETFDELPGKIRGAVNTLSNWSEELEINAKLMDEKAFKAYRELAVLLENLKGKFKDLGVQTKKTTSSIDEDLLKKQQDAANQLKMLMAQSTFDRVEILETETMLMIEEWKKRKEAGIIGQTQLNDAVEALTKIHLAKLNEINREAAAKRMQDFQEGANLAQQGIQGFNDVLVGLEQNKLAKIDALNAEGKMSDEAAAKARAKIIKRQDKLNKIFAAAQIPIEIAKGWSKLAEGGWPPNAMAISSAMNHFVAAAKFGLVAGRAAPVPSGVGGGGDSTPAGAGQGGGEQPRQITVVLESNEEEDESVTNALAKALRPRLEQIETRGLA